MTTPNLELPEISESQYNKHITHNEALRILDAVVQLAVIDRDLTAPPGGPSESDVYIVASAATGDWIGEENSVAYYYQSQWNFLTPNDGWAAWVQDENVLVNYSSTASEWVARGAYELPITYVSVDTSITVNDATKMFGVYTSTASRTIYMPDASASGNGFISAVFKASNDVNTLTVDGNGANIDGSTTFTLPDYNDSLYMVCNGSTEWKTIQKNVRTDAKLSGIEFQGYTETFVNVSASTATTNLSIASANVFNVVLQNNTTINFTNVPTGKVVPATIFVTQDGTGNRSMSVTGAIYASGGASTVTQDSDSKDLWTYATNDGGSTWYAARGGGKFV